MMKYKTTAIIFILTLFLFPIGMQVHAQTIRTEEIPPTSELPEGDSELSADEEEDPRLKLTIIYQIEEEEKPFLITTYYHDVGFLYNIAVPYIEGYEPDTPRLSGIMDEDTEITVVYHLKAYTLTIHFRLLDGNPAAPDHLQQEFFGSEYRFISPNVPGYKAIKSEIADEMPGRDVELTVFYVEPEAIIE